MKFPMRDAMTAEQIVVNSAAQQDLVCGKYYRFGPPVTATAIPTGGPNICALEKCTFEHGWYIGFKEGNHVFQGKPINDQRVIPVPRGYDEDTPNLNKILEQLRESYFHALFIGGSVAVLDTDQNYH